MTPFPTKPVPGLLGFACAAWALAASAAAPVVPETIKGVVRQRVDYGYNAGIVIGLVNADGRTVFAYGNREAGTPSPVDETSLFEVGSVTKVFTATLLAEAVDRGEVRLEDPVQDLLPATVPVPGGSAPIRLLHLATHRSGLPNNPDNLCSDDIARPFDCYSEDALFAFLSGHTLRREPGQAWEYSNTGVGLLGAALAHRAGKPYADLLRERLLDPLGLVDTSPDIPDAAVGRLARGHSGALDRPAFLMPGLEGAGVLRSSASDLMRFLEFQLGFRESTLASAVLLTHASRSSTTYPGIEQGLGWWLWGLSGGRVLQHGGDTPGQTAFIAFHPVRKAAAVVLSNSRANAYAAITDVGLRLLDPSYPLTSIRRPASVPESTLARYAGRYLSDDGDRFEAGLVRGRLVLDHARSRFQFTLYPESARRFYAPEIELGAGATAEFRTNAVGRVISLLWTQGGQLFTYLREADPARLVLVPAGERVEIRLTGDVPETYSLEASVDLRTWTELGPIGVSTPAFVDAPPPGGGQRFFRARRQDP